MCTQRIFSESDMKKIWTAFFVYKLDLQYIWTWVFEIWVSGFGSAMVWSKLNKAFLQILAYLMAFQSVFGMFHFEKLSNYGKKWRKTLLNVTKNTFFCLFQTPKNPISGGTRSVDNLDSFVLNFWKPESEAEWAEFTCLFSGSVMD